MGDDNRKRVGMLRLYMDKVNVEPIDFGDEIGQSVEPGLTFSPVIVVRPIGGELLHRGHLHALRIIRDGFLVWPACRQNPALEVGEVFVGGMKFERPDGLIAGFGQRERTLPTIAFRGG